MEQTVKLSDAVFKTSSMYCEDLKLLKEKVQKTLDKHKYQDLIELFFGENKSVFSQYKIQLEGDIPNTNFNYVYNSLNNRFLENMPLFVTMSECADFASLYNYESVMDRSSFAANIFSIRVSSFILPLFVLYVEYGYPYFSRVETKLSIKNGSIKMVFSVLKPFISSHAVKNSDVFKFLIDELHLADKNQVVDILQNKLRYVINDGCLIVSYQFFKPKNLERTERILKFVYAKQAVGSAEIAEYFGISKRTANYILADLVKQNILIREGIQNSSLTKYRVNEKEYFNLIN